MAHEIKSNETLILEISEKVSSLAEEVKDCGHRLDVWLRGIGGFVITVWVEQLA